MNDTILMQNGMKCLRDNLGVIEAERFVFNIKSEKPFNYTEWRRENLYEDISLEDLAKKAAAYCEDHKSELIS
ncbi:hypothetical protein FACS1894187_09950 [Synergistales bacterium]|nr:hypothetical protein FACS1894187_09950 [Synergistales bacterium]